MTKFDDIIEEVGAFGKYQAFLLLMFLAAAIPTSYNTFLPLFVLTTPNHRCALDNYPNDTYAVQSEYHRELINSSIPMEDHNGERVMASCYIYRQSTAPTGPPNLTSDRDYSIKNLALSVTRLLGGQNTMPTKTPNSTGSQTDFTGFPDYYHHLGDREKMKCHRWVYDHTFFDISFIEKLNLVCDDKEFRTHSNVAMMVGKFVSAFLQGLLSDRLGRRFTLLLFLVVVVGSTFANAFIMDVQTLIIFRFIAGLSTTSFFMNAYIITLEFLGPKYRQRFNMTAAMTWLGGGFLLTGVAYFIHDSKTLVLVLAAPTPLLFSFFFLVPESPRWLLSRGRVAEAKVILERMAKVNKRKFPAELFEKLVVEQQEIGDQNDTHGEGKNKSLPGDNDHRHSKETGDAALSGVTVYGSGERRVASEKEYFSTLFKYKYLTVRLLIVLWNWCANSMTYYGILFNTQNLSGSIYRNFTLTNAVDVAGNLASYYFVDKFGRKKTYVVCYLIASLALLAAIFPSFYATKEAGDLSIVLLIMVGRAGVSTTFNILYLYVAELFPTTMRNSVLGVSSMASRVGSTSAPYIADLGVLLGEHMEAALPMAVFGGAGLLATLSAIFLPETVNRKLPNSIEEAMEIARSTNSEGPRSISFEHSPKNAEEYGADFTVSPKSTKEEKTALTVT